MLVESVCCLPASTSPRRVESGKMVWTIFSLSWEEKGDLAVHSCCCLLTVLLLACLWFYYYHTHTSSPFPLLKSPAAFIEGIFSWSRELPVESSAYIYGSWRGRMIMPVQYFFFFSPIGIRSTNCRLRIARLDGTYVYYLMERLVVQEVQVFGKNSLSRLCNDFVFRV